MLMFIRARRTSCGVVDGGTGSTEDDTTGTHSLTVGAEIPVESRIGIGIRNSLNVIRNKHCRFRIKIHIRHSKRNILNRRSAGNNMFYMNMTQLMYNRHRVWKRGKFLHYNTRNLRFLPPVIPGQYIVIHIEWAKRNFTIILILLFWLLSLNMIS